MSIGTTDRQTDMHANMYIHTYYTQHMHIQTHIDASNTSTTFYLVMSGFQIQK